MRGRYWAACAAVGCVGIVVLLPTDPMMVWIVSGIVAISTAKASDAPW